MELEDGLDSLPQEWERGNVTVGSAAMKIMEIVYTNPGRFNLLDMDEDERSDFLLDALPKFEGLLARYDKRLGPLGAYVYFSLPGMRRSWTRKVREAEIGKKAAKAGVRDIYEAAMEKTAVCVAEKKPQYETWDSFEGGNELIFRRVLSRRKSLLESKENFYRRRSAFLLALKSAWYINDEGIKKLSGYLGCPPSGLSNIVDEVKSSLVEKNERRRSIEEKRDKAWYFVCKYRARLKALDPSSEGWKTTKRKLDYQMRSWKRKNQILQGCRMTVAPKNNELARLLKIHPHRISAFLNYAKKMADSGETILSNDSVEEEG